MLFNKNEQYLEFVSDDLYLLINKLNYFKLFYNDLISNFETNIVNDDNPDFGKNTQINFSKQPMTDYLSFKALENIKQTLKIYFSNFS